LAVALMENNEFDAAISVCDDAIKFHPDAGAAYYCRSIANFRANNYDRAWADLAEAKQRGHSPKPDYVEALMRATTAK